ncbi:MAG: hypothetical protein HOV81_32500 [Kofleriaceae bacterium]|nr:hypothetical protein [Kofleriaceae bacterium]
MKWPAALVAVVAAAHSGCGNKSKLDVDRGRDVDALWELAPDGTRLAVVASPKAVRLAFQAVDAIRELTEQPDLQPVKPQIDMVAQGLFGSATAKPEDAGFTRDRGFAMFATKDGVIGIMPIADRDKFMQSKHGKRGSGADAEDTLEENICKELRGHYICATTREMLERLGKGSLAGKLDAGERGDVELFMADATLLGDTKGDLALAAKLEPGTIDLYGRWKGTPSGFLAQLVGVAAPHAPIAGASGFVALNVAPLFASAPAIPIAGGVTYDALARSLQGPVSAVIPAGTVDIQVHAPLADPGPATQIIEHCPELGSFFQIAEKQTPGACRIVLQGTNAVELDAWVENNELRLGAKKGAVPAGKPGAVTAIGKELATGDWTAALWGRGTMLNLANIAPASEQVQAEVAVGIHAIALVNELGAAIKVESTGVKLRAYLRTAWTNPPEVVSKISAISGNDIVTGKATEPAAAIASSAPGSPFAADFAAGQGGLMIPAAAIGLASAVIIPAVINAIAPAPAE